MTSKAALLIIPLAAIMLVSGCVTSTGTAGTGPGVVIQDWMPDFTQVDSGEKVRLQLKVQNQGSVKAENTKAEIAGIDLNDWGTFGFGGEEKEIGDLLPHDIATNTEGETQTVYWDLTAPTLSKGTSLSYEPIIKLSYDYRTTAQKPITIVDTDELRTIQQQGKSLPSKLAQYTTGPLSIDVQTGDYVKTSDDYGTSYDIFPIKVKITNTQFSAGGTVMKGDGFGYFGGGEANYPVEITITPPTGTSFVYSGFGSDCGSSVVMDLWQGREAEITCELEVTDPPAYRTEKTITVEAKYRFQTEATTSINVIGTGESGWF